MKLQRLILENYRSHPRLELDFSAAQTACIVGPNARGKTNVLEALYLLALTKSFRAAAQEELIAWDSDYCRVQGFFEPEQEKNGSSNGQVELEVFLGRPPQPRRALKVNKVKVAPEKFLGNCQMVFFHPEDMNMLSLGPSLRRRYLDVLNIQVNTAYYRALREYKKALRQRNALLKGAKTSPQLPSEFPQSSTSSPDHSESSKTSLSSSFHIPPNQSQSSNMNSQLDLWDDQLVQHGTTIIEQRAAATLFLSQKLEEIYSKIAGTLQKLTINYQSSIAAKATPTTIKGTFKEALLSARPRDLAAKVTTVGPHRDDLTFTLNNKPISAHASRGEYRSLLLTLKLLEVDFYTQKTGQKPLLLLDDVFSELDLSRQKMLIEAIESHQTVLTATHLDDIFPQRTHRSLKTSTIGAAKKLTFITV